MVKLFVYKTVKCEVINVEFFSRDLTLNNSVIIVTWKCLKLLYSWKGMYRIDSQLKKLIRLKYLILGTLYTFFSIFSWYFVVLNSFNFLSPMLCFHVFFFGFPSLSFFVFVFTTLEKKISLNIFSIDLILFHVKAL